MIESYYVIDAHCHVYPDKILPAAVDATAHFYQESASHGGTTQELLQAGQAAGIDRHLICSVATTPRQVRSIQSFIASQVSIHQTRLSGLGTAHPESTDLLGDLHHAQDLGLHGLKIHPDIQGFPIDCPGFQKLYALCEKENMPILAHTGDGRYDYSNPNRLLPLLRSHPGLTVVGGHFAGWGIWESAWTALHGEPNLYVDCSSALCYIPADVSKKIIRAFGADRVLFGTDYPLHPVKRELRLFWELGLEPEENRRILSENAKKVFHI